MPLTPATVEIPLATDPQGAVRVGGTRVTIERIVTAFHAGATPEEIAQQFPALALADIYQVVAHYLTHVDEVNSYRTAREKDAAVLRREIESGFNPVGLRARLLARRSGSTS